MQVGIINNNYNNKYKATNFKKILRNNIPEKAIKDNNYLLLVSGPSGVGKDTIMNKILHKFNKVVTHTTRPKREGEVEGKSYFYTTVEQFKEGIKNNEFIEYVKGFSGNYYGTKKETVKNALDGKKPALLIVDIDGADAIKKNLKNNSNLNVVSIFIKPPSFDILKARLLKRGTETPDAMQERLNKAMYEMQHAQNFDAEIQNNHFTESIKDLEELLHI